MTDSVILNTPIIVVVTILALIMNVAGRFVGNKYVRAGLYIASFLCVVGCVTYALLLGVELNELLTYVLIFTLVGITSFIPAAHPDLPPSAPMEGEEQSKPENTEGKNEL